MAKRPALFDMFQWLSDDAGAALAAAAVARRIPAGGTIYDQWEEGDEMFRLVSGSVRLSVMGEDGRELLYLLFAPGDCFGTSSLVDGEVRPQRAEAFEAVQLQVFSRAAIFRLRREYPEINDALLKLLSRHMRLLSDYFAGATLDEVSARLAQRLVDIAESFGTESDAGIALTMRLSQSELAAMVGTARQTVNRVLHRFQRKGWIALRAGVVVITDLAGLAVAAQKGARVRNFQSRPGSTWRSVGARAKMTGTAGSR